MSEISDLKQQVALLTQRLNDLTTQAKKIPELPYQNTLNPASLIHVSISGISQYLSLQQIISAILDFKFNRLISVAGPITVSGNDVTIPPAVWVMENINYQTTSNTVINAPYAATGYTRTDIVVGDKFNVIYRIAGPETEGISPTPNTPLDTVLITTIDITDSTIGDPITPPEGDPSKLDKGSYTGGAANNLLDDAKTYADSIVIGLLDDRGNYDASSNLYPSTGGSGASGAVLKGDLWTISVAGTLGGVAVTAGDVVRALVNTPGQTSANWVISENNIGYVPENSDNKKTVIAGNEASSSFFGVIKAWIDWLKDGFASQIPAKSSTLVDNDRLLVFDSADSNKTKYRLWAQLKSNLASIYFLDATSSIQTQINGKQIIDDQIEISSSMNVQNAWHGKTILFTANCTITVPATLNNSLMFVFRTLPGVTVTWAITSPFTWETTPLATTEKTVGNFMRRGSTTSIILDV